MSAAIIRSRAAAHQGPLPEGAPGEAGWGSIMAPAGIPARLEIAIRDLKRLGDLRLRGYQAGEWGGANRNFRPRRSTGDADIKRGMRLVIDRCRDQYINNPSIRGAIRRMVNNAVRDGISPRFRFRNQAGEPLAEANRAWETLFSRWAIYAGLNRRQSLWTMQRLVMAAMWSDGECYAHRAYDDRVPGIPPLRLELLERDMLDTSVDGELPGGNIARMGKELDAKTGEIVAYHFLARHPGDYQGFRRETRRIPASEIIDVHEADRISQTAGMPWLASLVMESWDLQEYRDYERIGAKLAAAFGIFVRNDNPTANPLGGLGVVPGAPGSDWPGAWGGNVSPLPDYIEPGRIQALPYGTDITIASHNRPGTQYEPYVKESRRTQSTGLGISYEAFANDYTDASYSSARSAALEERLTYQGMQFFLSETYLDPVVRWFVESAWQAGLNPHPMPGFAENPWPYLESFVQANPGWQWVDPAKDAAASERKIQLGLSSHYREAMQAGLDFDENAEELKRAELKLREVYELRAANARILEGNNNG